MRQVTRIAVLARAGLLTLARKFFSKENAEVTSTRQRDHDHGNEAKYRLWKIGKYFLAFMVLMVIGGFLGAVSGIIPIKASSGHWAITSWFLQFSKQRSVATHTLGIEVPLLDESSLVLKGAGAYEMNCRACHGSPSVPNPRVAQHMTPRPPYLPSTIGNWEPAELFYIVKHGIKFTGMPAWPAARPRDDEVWAMVAFLQRFPNLTDDDYRRLVYGDVAVSGEALSMDAMQTPEPRVVTTNCARCHGRDGLGRGSEAFPSLAGQQVQYLDLSMQAYAKGERHSGIMGPIASGLSVDEIGGLARYYSGLSKRSSSSLAEDASAIERGSVIAQQGIPSQRVPACIACHGPSDIPRNPIYPTLAGQYAGYLVLQLELFKNENRGGTAHAHLMRMVATRLTPEQMRDVATYYGSLSLSDDRSAP